MPLPRRALPAALALPALARAQGPDFPARPVRLVVPFPPGGGLDILARALAERLALAWRQPVLVDNRPGAASVPGTDLAAKAAADGHTLLVTADNPITAAPLLIRALPHDPQRDLLPVSLLVEVHQMLLVHPAVPARSLAELVAAARAAPGGLAFGSYGHASQPHLAFAALMARERIALIHVPYRGVPPALLATVAGEVQMTLAGLASAREHLLAGTLRALAVGRPARLAALPAVPTLAEAGYPEIDPRPWFGVFAPAGTPAALVARLARDIAAAMAEPGLRERHLLPNGYTVQAGTPEGAAGFVREDLEHKRRLIAAAGLQPD